jgi:hypothetical protein
VKKFPGVAALVVVVVISAAAFTATKADDPRTVFTKVGAALEAHAITPCETSDWTARLDAFDRSPGRGDRAQRERLVNITTPCPPDETDNPDEIDGRITIVVSKSATQRKKGVSFHDESNRFGYTYGRSTLILLHNLAPPQLEEAFLATMTDLHARRVLENPRLTRRQ